MRDYSLYEAMDMPDPNFPIKIHKIQVSRRGKLFPRHWHEHIEILYIVKGQAVFECSQNPLTVSPGDLVIVNANELHQGESISDSLFYYCIIMDCSLLLGQLHDICESKYISPIFQNLIVFRNKISGDASVKNCVDHLIREYEERQTGFELELKSSVFHLLVILLRNYAVRILTKKEYGLREKNIDRFNEIFQYIEANYTERVTVRQCAKMLSVTDSYFCHLFKLIVGKTLSSYVNYLRLSKAQTLLKNTGMNITEVALATGFNDITYFTRLFKKYTDHTPTEFRNENAG